MIKQESMMSDTHRENECVYVGEGVKKKGYLY